MRNRTPKEGSGSFFFALAVGLELGNSFKHHRGDWNLAKVQL
jgi:hypothetical protein